jgi:hypothetical protein
MFIISLNVVYLLVSLKLIDSVLCARETEVLFTISLHTSLQFCTEIKSNNCTCRAWRCDLKPALLSRSRYTSRSSCDQQTRLRFSLFSLGPRTRTEMRLSFHDALCAFRAALPYKVKKFHPNGHTNPFLRWRLIFAGSQ